MERTATFLGNQHEEEEEDFDDGDEVEEMDIDDDRHVDVQQGELQCVCLNKTDLRRCTKTGHFRSLLGHCPAHFRARYITPFKTNATIPQWERACEKLRRYREDEDARAAAAFAKEQAKLLAMIGVCAEDAVFAEDLEPRQKLVPDFGSSISALLPRKRGRPDDDVAATATTATTTSGKKVRPQDSSVDLDIQGLGIEDVTDEFSGEVRYSEMHKLGLNH